MIPLVHNDDIVNFCNHYDGELFHAVFCDPPYHLTSIVERFGKEGSAPAKDDDGLFQHASAGFMGKEWDGGDIAFDPETWKAIGKLMLPGAFGMAFAATRNYHRMATAIEDAGFYIHPMIVWVQGQGFPKASNPQKLLEKRGDERAEQFEGYRYGAQALKPVLEPICVFQKPWDTDNQIDSILEHGTGLYDIDGGRISTDDSLWGGAYQNKEGKTGAGKAYEGGWKHISDDFEQPQGRWPTGLILEHLPDCRIVGYKDDNYTINCFDNGAKPWGDAQGEDFHSVEMEGKTPVWECVDDCPVLAMDNQTGNLGKSQGGSAGHEAAYQGGYKKEYYGDFKPGYGDSGGASRFFYQTHYRLEENDPFVYQAKASKSEKNEGLDNMPLKSAGIKNDSGRGFSERNPYNEIKMQNNHPTVKPIDLCKYLTGLLLPPEAYKERRILIPFSGSGSEMIGAHLSGWDHVEGVELESEYVEIANARIEHWCKLAKQLELF